MALHTLLPIAEARTEEFHGIQIRMEQFLVYIQARVLDTSTTRVESDEFKGYAKSAWPFLLV